MTEQDYFEQFYADDERPMFSFRPNPAMDELSRELGRAMSDYYAAFQGATFIPEPRLVFEKRDGKQFAVITSAPQVPLVEAFSPNYRQQFFPPI